MGKKIGLVVLNAALLGAAVALACWGPKHAGFPLAVGGFFAALFLQVGAMKGVLHGVDGRPSSSKLQQWLWTPLFTLGFVSLLTARASAGVTDPLDIPEWLLGALGLSVVTGLTAKLIGTQTGSQKAGVAEPAPSGAQNASTGPTDGTRAFFADDAGRLDLTKIHMLLWTVIAVVVHGVVIVRHLLAYGLLAEKSPDKAAELLLTFPDIDGTLVLLAGLGQASYIGGKLIAVNGPYVSGVWPTHPRAGERITVGGSGFVEHSTAIMIDDRKLKVEDTHFVSTTQLEWVVPGVRPDGALWSDRQEARLQVLVGGTTTAPTTIKIAVPRIAAFGPDVEIGQTYKITGENFIAEAMEARVDGLKVDGLRFVAATELQWTVPPTHPNGNVWVLGAKHELRIVVNGVASAPHTLTIVKI